MYFDTHCHISKEYYDDIDLLMKENKEANVEKIVISGCEKNAMKETIDLSLKYSSIYITLGYHPNSIEFIGTKELKLLENLLVNTPKVVALGEIGLDYHWGKETVNKQKDMFRKQMELAEKLNLPVVIHSRDAVKDTVEVLKEFNCSGVIHCFTEDLATAKEYISLGYKLGIGGIVTFKNSKLKEVIKEISLENIVLETDAPYLAPEPFRGKTNSSKYLYLIAKEIAKIKDLEEKEVVDILYQNSMELFDLHK